MKRTVVTSITFEKEPLIITDPCYLKEFSDDEIWSDFCDRMYGDKRIFRTVPYEESNEKKEFFAEFVGKHGDIEDQPEVIKDMLNLHKRGYNPERVLSYYCEQPNFICSSTNVGDWVCDVINIDKNRKIGSFCADAGFVCVAKAKDFHLEDESSDWLYTKIDEYTGVVDIVLYEYENGDDGYEEPIEPNGIVNKKYRPTFFVCVEGKGTINFKSIDMMYVI